MFRCNMYFGELTYSTRIEDSFFVHTVQKITTVLSFARERTLDRSGRLEPCLQPESKEEL